MKNAAFHTAHILSRQDGCHKYILYRPNANLDCWILRQLMLRMVMLLLAYFRGNHFRFLPVLGLCTNLHQHKGIFSIEGWQGDLLFLMPSSLSTLTPLCCLSSATLHALALLSPGPVEHIGMVGIYPNPLLQKIIGDMRIFLSRNRFAIY